MKILNRLLTLTALLTVTQSVSALPLVDDTNFTANNSTAGGGYIYASPVTGASLTGGTSLAFSTANTGAEDGSFSFVRREFASTSMSEGDALQLSFDVSSINGSAFDFRDFGFGFSGNSGNLPDTDSTSVSFDDTYYSIGGGLTDGGGQWLISGRRSDFFQTPENPLKYGGVSGNVQGNTGPGVVADTRIFLDITRVADTVDGDAQYSVALGLTPDGGSFQSIGSVATISSSGAASDWTSWDGLFIGTGDIDLGGDPNFTIDNLTVDYTAIPEPSTFAFMIGGFLALGAAMLRRQG